MKKHDEGKDLRSISRIGFVSVADKTIKIAKTARVGIKTWGKLDYLCNHCNWTLIYDNSIVVKTPVTENQTSVREAKKARKEHQLTDKTKRISKKN